jgi:hypothetical protein
MATKKKQKKEVEDMNRKVMMAGAGAAAMTPAVAPGDDPAMVLTTLRAVDNGEHAAEECAARARQIRISTLDLDEKADALAEEIRANNLAGDCAQIEIDLNAARVRVSAIPPEQVAELTALSRKLDRQIVVGQLLSTALTAVTEVLESVVKVRDILSDPGLRV